VIARWANYEDKMQTAIEKMINNPKTIPVGP
jgi:hypothetical protein